jgi:pimeloyl-ACP methyl ester carboxylesterase
MVALRAALTVPERVSGLILVDTDAGAERAFKKLKYRAMGVGARLLGIRPFLPGIVPLMFGRTTRETRPELVEEWSGRFAAMHVPSLLRYLDALMTRDSVVDRLHQIDVPAVVIVGEEDASLPLALSSRIAAGLRDSSLVRVPGAGHLSALEQPGAVTEAMLGFLDRLGG